MRIPDAGDAVGNVTLVRLVQLENAQLPMLVTLSGMVMLVRLSAVIECDSRCW